MCGWENVKTMTANSPHQPRQSIESNIHTGIGETKRSELMNAAEK